MFEIVHQQTINTKTRKVTTMMQTIRQFVKEEAGVAAAEYAILLGMIAVALITAVTTFRGAIQNVFSQATNTLSS